MSYTPDSWHKDVLTVEQAEAAVAEGATVLFIISAYLKQYMLLRVTDPNGMYQMPAAEIRDLFPDVAVLESPADFDGSENIMYEISSKSLEYYEVLKLVAQRALRNAEQACYRWACECELDQGRIKAFSVYENVRHASFVG